MRLQMSFMPIIACSIWLVNRSLMDQWLVSFLIKLFTESQEMLPIEFKLLSLKSKGLCQQDRLPESCNSHGRADEERRKAVKLCAACESYQKPKKNSNHNDVKQNNVFFYDSANIRI